MNSAYTYLEQSLACKEMGAEQITDGFVWYVPRGYKEWRLINDHAWWIRAYGDTEQWVVALPFYTDDPNEQSVVGLLKSLGFIIERKVGSGRYYWRAEKAWWGKSFDSLGALLMACYEKWKLNNA